MWCLSLIFKFSWPALVFLVFSDSLCFVSADETLEGSQLFLPILGWLAWMWLSWERLSWPLARSESFWPSETLRWGVPKQPPLLHIWLIWFIISEQIPDSHFFNLPSHSAHAFINQKQRANSLPLRIKSGRCAVQWRDSCQSCNHNFPRVRKKFGR